MKSLKVRQPGELFNAHQEKMKKRNKNWIQGAIKHPGALHAELGIKQGHKIPAKTLAKAAKKGGKIGRRARLAETLKGIRGKKRRKMTRPAPGYAYGSNMKIPKGTKAPKVDWKPASVATRSFNKMTNSDISNPLSRGTLKLNKRRKGKKWTRAQDDAYDKKHGLKEGSKRDIAEDKAHGIKDKRRKGMRCKKHNKMRCKHCK